MITVTEHALRALGFDPETPLMAVQQVRHLITEDDSSKVIAGRGLKLINDLLGTNVAHAVLFGGVAHKDQADWELLVTQAVAEAVVRAAGQPIDEVEVLAAAAKRVTALMTEPRHRWMFAKKEAAATAGGEVVQVVADVEVHVEVKANGKLKKGGYGTLARELYIKRVLEGNEPITNAVFVEMLVKEVGMTKGGATTYAYNLDKELGPKLVKKQRGAVADPT